MKVVIACRVSPKQKAEIVELVKNKYPEKRTLAIGDGANDVNMITAAHIGVGISGLEGQQAARASDYAIGQFKFLRNLLFVHGRESYRKNSYVVCYMFYKDVLFVMCIFWYGTVSAFSGLTIFEQWLYQLYNILFSCFPIMWFAVFDYELPKQILSKHPKYYIYTVNPTLTNYKFGRWIFYAVWQSIVLCILAFFPFESQGGSFWMEGNFVYLGVVLIVNIKILCDTSNHTLISLILAIGSIIMFLGGTVAVNYIKITELYGTLEQTLPSFEFYYILILILLAIVQIDIGVNYVNRQLRKRIIRVVHKLQKNLKFPRFRKSKIGQEKKPKKKIRKYLLRCFSLIICFYRQRICFRSRSWKCSFSC